MQDEESVTLMIGIAAILCWLLAVLFLFWPSHLTLESCGSVMLPEAETGPICGSLHLAQIGRALLAALVSGALAVCWLTLRKPRPTHER